MLLKHSGNVFFADATFAEKDIPKGAGFRWKNYPAGWQPPGGKHCWWTNDIEKAFRLAQYATNGTRPILEEKYKERAKSVVESRATDSDIVIPHPGGLEYRPFQRAGIAYAIQRKGTLIADEMGLGKTIQAIGVINHFRYKEKILIICPAFLKLNWQMELQKWLVDPLTIGIAEGSDFPETDVVIINYDICARHEERLKKEPWSVLVIDECHFIKNPKAQRTLAIVGGQKVDPNDKNKKIKVPGILSYKKIGLTGTPIENKPIELWTLVSAIAPDIFNNFWDYAKRFCDATKTRYGWDMNGASNPEELQRKLRETVMIRRLKSEVLKELPPKQRQIIQLPMDSYAKKVLGKQVVKVFTEMAQDIKNLKKAVDEAKSADDTEAYKRAVLALEEGEESSFEEMSKTRKKNVEAKLISIIRHVENALEGGGKVIVFGWHKAPLEELREHFRDISVLVHGDVAKGTRHQYVQQFQNDPETTLFIGTIGAAGVGLTLTASSHVIFVEYDWVPGKMIQAEDRAHRIGQTDSVLVQYLVLEGSIDATLARTVIRKQEIIDRALDNKTPEREDLAESTATEEDESQVSTPTKTQKPTAEATLPGKPLTAQEKKKQQMQLTAEKLSADQISAIHEALRILAGICDGATTHDGQGFNKMDTNFGKDLAERSTLTPLMAAYGRKMVMKYKRQYSDELYTVIKGGESNDRSNEASV